MPVPVFDTGFTFLLSRPQFSPSRTSRHSPRACRGNARAHRPKASPGQCRSPFFLVLSSSLFAPSVRGRNHTENRGGVGKTAAFSLLPPCSCPSPGSTNSNVALRPFLFLSITVTSCHCSATRPLVSILTWAPCSTPPLPPFPIPLSASLRHGCTGAPAVSHSGAGELLPAKLPLLSPSARFLPRPTCRAPRSWPCSPSRTRHALRAFRRAPGDVAGTAPLLPL